MTTQVQTAVAPAPASLRFTLVTAAAAITAAAAAWASTGFGLPVWAMFVGWVAYYSRGHSARDGALNLICLLAGLAIGLLASVAIGALMPRLGTFSVAVVVFAVAMIVVSLRALPWANNIPAYFLGLIAWFAHHAQPTLEAYAELGSAGALGSFAAWFAGSAQKRLAW